MITVYDMTSGTLRKELEDKKQPEGSNQTIVFEEPPCETELQLQEVEWSEHEEKTPEWLQYVNVTDFMDIMK